MEFVTPIPDCEVNMLDKKFLEKRAAETPLERKIRLQNEKEERRKARNIRKHKAYVAKKRG